MTLAALGIEAKTEGVDKATDQLKELTGAAGKAEAATDKLSPAAKKAGADVKGLGNDAKTADGSLAKLAGGIGTVVGKLAAMAAAALSVGAYIKLADSWSDLRSQLGAAIGDMGAASDMMQRMVDIANASYSPLDQTVEVYARNVGVLRDLGKSAAQAADFTESLNHMLVITATKGERATSVQQIEKMVRISEELYRPIASGKEARAIYQIGTFYSSVEETLEQNGWLPNPQCKPRRAAIRGAA